MDGERVMWGPAIRDFETYLSGTDRAPLTVRAYVYHVRRFSESAPAGPWELTSAQLAAWLDQRGWAQVTRGKVVVAFRAFYAWAVATDRCLFAPTAGLSTSTPRRPGPRARRLPPAWAEPVEAWQAWARSSSRGEGTVKTQAAWIRRLAEVAADPWGVTTEQLARWLSNPDWKPATKRSAQSSVGVFYRWAVKTKRIETSPVVDLESVLIPRSLPRPAPDEAFRDALAAADQRMRLALMLGGYAGLRAAEIASVHLTQVTDSALLVIGKGGHHRQVPLHPDLRDEIRGELARRRSGGAGSGFGRGASPTGWLFPSTLPGAHMTPGHMTVLLSLALPDGWTAHNLRHRFATAVYAVERDLLTVQQLLGHARPETTARYAAVPDGAKMRAVAAIGL